MKSIYLLLFLVLASCTSIKKNTTNNSTIKETKPIDSQIIFLTYKVSKDKNIELTFIDKIITAGSLKKNFKKRTSSSPGDLICIQQDVNSVAIDSIQIENPLIKNFEYADDSGKLSRKTIELDSTTLSIRMDLKPQTKFITLKLLRETNNSLLKIQL
ncbi:hypothetical protein [Polaribacter sp. HaHaR_3_91]|uniref:hypothetical protein n=1 Tax=Polaribacter sp. HaHaR_3_91 TaxID=2745561 RepID=UPI001C4EB447|nr:hypothetical protein [Polaribacter sp. HaHaR_3_91]QXP64723.1 hypothetical protein H0I27_05955 [Polaribacter sp. HaHaR_3_91]